MGANFRLYCCYRLWKRFTTQFTTHKPTHDQFYVHCSNTVQWRQLPSSFSSSQTQYSGECNIMREMYRGRFVWSKGHQECVKRRAALSLAANGQCKVIRMVLLPCHFILPLTHRYVYHIIGVLQTRCRRFFQRLLQWYNSFLWTHIESVTSLLALQLYTWFFYSEDLVNQLFSINCG